MRYILVGLLSIVIIFTLIGCEKPTNEEVYYDIQKTFNTLESYECKANITIKKKDSTNSYKAKHIYQKPDKYRIEIIAEEKDDGLITVYNGSNAWVYYPKIEESILIKDIKNDSDKNTFLGYFLGVSITSEYTELKEEVLGDEEYIVVSVEIPGNNSYRNSAKVWINKDKYTPHKMVIFDQKENPTIEVMYSDFEYNENIDDDKFSFEK